MSVQVSKFDPSMPLRTCPHCGGKAKQLDNGLVGCVGCDNYAHFRTVASWQQRHPENELQKTIEAIRQIAMDCESKINLRITAEILAEIKGNPWII